MVLTLCCYTLVLFIFVGKLVSIRGTIIRVANMKLICTWMAFSCNNCGTLQSVQQSEGVYTQPTICSASTCRNRTFIPICSSEFTQTINWQPIRLQEIVDDDEVS